MTNKEANTMKNNILSLVTIVVFAGFVLALLASNVPAQVAKPNIIASIDFNPTEDGYSFRNYGGSSHDGSEDLDADDLIELFGAESVCIEGSTANDCVLYETADEWREKMIKMADGGHCLGFSVTSMRMFLDLPYRDKTTPAEFQKGAEVTHDLKPDEDLFNLIAHFHIVQTLREVYSFRGSGFKLGPAGVIKLLTESFRNGKEHYDLAIFNRVNGKLERGHSILPFAIEDMGGGIVRIHAYDNNFPGQTKYVTINTKTNEWRYRTASNPADVARDYIGNASTNSLSLNQISDFDYEEYECPFCEKDNGSRKAKGNAPIAPAVRQMKISFSGAADLLITDPNKKQIGYDSKAKAEVNQIGGADVIYTGGDGPEDYNYSPTYALPYNPAAKTPYNIVITGTDLKKEEDADLSIEGPGFVIGFSDILLDPKEQLSVSVAPNGESLSFTASADGETPTVFITTEDGPNKPSYSFEVGGVSIDGGKTLTMTVDVEHSKVFFKDNDGNEDAYDVHIERTNADGTKIKFDSENMNQPGDDSFEVDFAKWDKDHQPCVEDDDDGDGFDDETCG